MATTANMLRSVIGDLSPERIAAAVESAKFEHEKREQASGGFGPLAIEVLVPTQTYTRLQAEFQGVSDEHNFKQLLDVLETT